MAVANQQIKLLEALKDDIGVAEGERTEQIFLTPYLALACGLLYLMAADGKLEAEESSQLQAVLGGDKEVLGYALRYVESVPIEQFFAVSSELLSVKDKWCILTNVCDALLSDGRADASELALFSQMTKAFGVSDAQFEPYFRILKLKNDKSVLGRYVGVRDERQPMTPHFALAISLLYMLTADGSIGEQEVGQLEAVIGEFEGLQNVALKYVRTVKLKQFLDEASALLRPEQKIYILTNVCDSMLSDGEVAPLEDKLFINMLSAFEFTEKTFARYLQVLETKNLKPFDASGFENHVTHDRMISGDDAHGVVFKNERSDAHAGGMASDASGVAEGVWVGAANDTVMSQFIARTMQENIQSVSDDFENQNNVVKVALNATDGLNLQNVEGDDATRNRQRIDDLAASVNVQTIDAASQVKNQQKIDSDSLDPNSQLLVVDGSGTNRQAIEQDAHRMHRENLSVEVRAQNIQEVVEVVNHRLDRFETEHHSFLQIGRGQKFSDDFVLIEDDASGVNRQLVNGASTRLGLGFTAAAASSGGAVAEAQESTLEASRSYSVNSQIQPVSVDLRGHAQVAVLSVVKGKRWAGFSGYVGKVRWMSHRRRFNYVQVAVATLAIVFAAPIGTQTISARSAAGTLIKAPISATQF